jgi:hypothetical protein
MMRRIGGVDRIAEWLRAELDTVHVDHPLGHSAPSLVDDLQSFGRGDTVSYQTPPGGLLEDVIAGACPGP